MGKSKEKIKMKLITPRLILREPIIKDAKDAAEGLNNKKVSRYLLAISHPCTIKDAKTYINHTYTERGKKPRKSYGFFIVLKSEKKVIGGISVRNVDLFQGTADIGYWLAEPYWRCGYGTESAKAILDFAFNKLKVRKIKIPIYTKNEASNALAKKLGAKLEGTLRKHCKVKCDGKIHDQNVYGLFKNEWAKARKRLR